MKLVPISLSDPVNLDNQVVIRSKPKKIGRSRPHIRLLDNNLIEKAKDLEAVWKAYDANIAALEGYTYNIVIDAKVAE